MKNIFVIALLFISSNLYSEVLKDEIPGLVALWTFNNDLVTGKVESEVNNLGGTLNGGTAYVDGMFGKGVRFTQATAGRLNVDSAEYIYQSRIILGAWVIFREKNFSGVIDIGVGWSGGTIWLGLDFVSELQYASIITYSGGARYCRGTTFVPVNDEKWHCVVGAFDGSDLMIFLDGNLENTISGNPLVYDRTKGLNIGSYSATTGSNQTVDSVFISSITTPASMGKHLVKEEIIRANNSFYEYGKKRRGLGK